MTERSVWYKIHINLVIKNKRPIIRTLVFLFSIRQRRYLPALADGAGCTYYTKAATANHSAVSGERKDITELIVSHKLRRASGKSAARFVWYRNGNPYARCSQMYCVPGKSARSWPPPVASVASQTLRISPKHRMLVATNWQRDGAVRGTFRVRRGDGYSALIPLKKSFKVIP